VGINRANSEPTSPIKMTIKPQKKCVWSFVIPVILPRTWREEYKRLMIKARTTPMRPVIRASVRIVNCSIVFSLQAAVLLGAFHSSLCP
jgi:hypothetical protein